MKFEDNRQIQIRAQGLSPCASLQGRHFAVPGAMGGLWAPHVAQPESSMRKGYRYNSDRYFAPLTRGKSERPVRLRTFPSSSLIKDGWNETTAELLRWASMESVMREANVLTPTGSNRGPVIAYGIGIAICLSLWAGLATYAWRTLAAPERANIVYSLDIGAQKPVTEGRSSFKVIPSH